MKDEMRLARRALYVRTGILSPFGARAARLPFEIAISIRRAGAAHASRNREQARAGAEAGFPSG